MENEEMDERKLMKSNDKESECEASNQESKAVENNASSVFIANEVTYEVKATKRNKDEREHEK